MKKLSKRVREGCEAAPWVIEEIKRLEEDLNSAESAVSDLMEIYDKATEVLSIIEEFEIDGLPCCDAGLKVVSAIRGWKDFLLSKSEDKPKDTIEVIFPQPHLTKDKYTNNDIITMLQEHGVPINDNGLLDYGFLSRQDTREDVIFVWNPTKE